MAKGTDHLDQFLTTGQAARYCGVNFRTVIRWVQRGQLEATRLPGRGDHRISVESLIRFMQQNGMPLPDEWLAAKKVSGPRRVLIVEDDLPFAHSLERILRLAGYETQIALGGFEAGLQIASFSPDVMTLDIHMAGMDGIEVLKALSRNDLLQKKTKVMIVSGDVSGRVQEAMSLGAAGFVAKPFQREELLKALDGLVHIT